MSPQTIQICAVVWTLLSAEVPERWFINQSINQIQQLYIKRRLNNSFQRSLYTKARLELFTTDTNAIEMAACSRYGMPWHGNCADHNALSEYVTQSCHRSQQREAGSQREQRRPVLMQPSRKYAVDRPQIQSSICHQRDFQSNQTQSIKLYCEMWQTHTKHWVFSENDSAEKHKKHVNTNILAN